MGPRRSPPPASLLRRAATLVLDVAIAALVGVALVVALTGGGAFEVAGLRIRATTLDNPIWMLTALVALRYAARSWGPILGVPRWRTEAAVAGGVQLMAGRVPRLLEDLARRPVRFLGVLSVAVAGVKLLLAWAHPGFFSGDDVEIHEMSLGALFDKPWPVWDLRSALYPMAFIHPAQRAAWSLGASQPEALVFAGRAVVALLSTAVLPLTWVAARRLAPGDPRLAALAVTLVAINKLQISFGSSELPRPVATVFVLAAFAAMLRGGAAAAAAGGAALGLASALRFSEIVFLVPAVLVLASRREPGRAAVFAVSTLAAAGGLTAAADALYWGEPFASLRAAFDYTLVARQSSRGFQPPWEYLRIVPAWTTVLFVLLALAGSRRTHPDAWWCWLPIGLLSLLPHKESRYLIPVVPFFSIAAARGLLRAAGWIRDAHGSAPRRWARDLLAPLVLLSVLHEVGGWRLVRSNEGIRLARHVRTAGGAGLAVQEPWRLGGRPYLWQHDPLVDLTSAALGDLRDLPAAAGAARFVALRSRAARAGGGDALHAAGFERDATWSGDDYVLYSKREPPAR